MERERLDASKDTERLLRKVASNLGSEAALPEGVLERLPEAIRRANGNSLDYCSAVDHRIEHLLGQGRVAEAITLLEVTLNEFPEDLLLQANSKRAWVRAVSILEGMGDQDPSNAEFGRGYLKLVELGQMSVEGHLHAIHHFRISGDLRRAVELAAAFYRLWPNAVGFRDAVETLASVSDDGLVHALLAELTAKNKKQGGNANG